MLQERRYQQPPEPEAPEWAVFGQWLWPSRREGLYDAVAEKDTELEALVYTQLRRHFASTSREGLPQDTAELLAGLVARGQYRDVLHPPPQETLYRGLKVATEDALSAILGGTVPSVAGGVDLAVRRPVTVGNGYSTSWSSVKGVTRDFSGAGKRGWAVTLLADTGDNPYRFLAGPGGLYDVEGLSRWHLERETVGLEPILVRRIEWQPLGEPKHEDVIELVAALWEALGY